MEYFQSLYIFRKGGFLAHNSLEFIILFFYGLHSLLMGFNEGFGLFLHSRQNFIYLCIFGIQLAL